MVYASISPTNISPPNPPRFEHEAKECKKKKLREDFYKIPYSSVATLPSRLTVCLFELITGLRLQPQMYSRLKA